MKEYFLVGGFLLIIAALSFNAGYDKAEVEYQLKMSELDRAHKAEIINVQQLEKEEYEKKTQTLVARFNSEHERHAQRMRELESKVRSGGSVAAITRERNECLELATEGESLLREAERFIEVMHE